MNVIRRVLFIVMVVSGVVLIGFVLNNSYFSDKVSCGTFGYPGREDKATCLIFRLDNRGMEGVQYAKYVAIGKVVALKPAGDDLLITLKTKTERGMQFNQPFRLLPHRDGVFEISEERRKWVGIFDNNRIIRFQAAEVKNIQKDLIGREVMLLYFVPVDDATSDSWLRLISWGKTTIGQFFLFMNGILNVYVPSVSQMGF